MMELFEENTTFIAKCGTFWYHLYNLKNVKNTHGGVLILEKWRLQPVTLLKLTLLHEYFSRFSNCTNGTIMRTAPQIRL